MARLERSNVRFESGFAYLSGLVTRSVPSDGRLVGRSQAGREVT